jgi:hypothetical protein
VTGGAGREAGGAGAAGAVAGGRAPGRAGHRSRLVVVGVGVLAVALVVAGAVVALTGRGPVSCARTAEAPAGDGEAVSAVLGAQPELADGLRVAVGGVSDDGCSAHLGLTGTPARWVAVGESVAAGDGELTVLAIRRGEGGGTGGDEVRRWYAPGPAAG